MYLVHREYFEYALNIYVKLYGRKHTRVTQVLVNLGSVFRNAGMKPKAIILYQEALAIQEEISGPNSLEVSHHFMIRILLYP